MAPASRNFSSLFAACLLFTLCSALEKVDLHESHIVPRAYSSTIKHLSDVVHGTIMGLAVIVIFPFGIMSWKLLGHVLSPRWLLRVHVGCQILGMALLITGFGTGVWVAILHAEVRFLPEFLGFHKGLIHRRRGSTSSKASSSWLLAQV